MKLSRWILGLVIVGAFLTIGMAGVLATQDDDAELGELVHISPTSTPSPNTGDPARHSPSTDPTPTKTPAPRSDTSATTPRTPASHDPATSTQAPAALPSRAGEPDPEHGAPKVTHQPPAAGDDDDHGDDDENDDDAYDGGGHEEDD